MTVLTSGSALASAASAAPKPRRSLAAYWLIAPGVAWMVLFLLLPILMMVYVSFWTQTTFKVEPILTAKSWVAFFSSDTYVGALWTTIRIWLVVLTATLVVGYPAALFVGLMVRNKTTATALLVLCVIPFWTSFLIRVLAWRPMLGGQGAVNIILEKLHIISQPIEALLFTELSVVIGMTQIYCVFMVGPIAFMLGRIDPFVIEAAQDLGAGFWRIFRTIIFPMSLPGVVVGAIFVSVMVLGEFATAAALSGHKVNLIGNIIVTQVGSLKWAFAAVAGVVLTAVIAVIVAVLLRLVDLRQEL
ncbi:ABC transporter permease [Lichenibacterium ramalinae]|uniref:ABC transporter permease n=1 Tax=Lichenibacterium ramalinae TaxID=2316527 RepID=A0A4Q2R5A9_9HYPH|nr:ABC transporter permease [Lichenibacterium ramalinae]